MFKKRLAEKSGYPTDAARLHERLEHMPPEEIAGEMADIWEAMGETDFDPQRIDAYLTALEEKDPEAVDFDAEAALKSFRARHAVLFEQLDAAAESRSRKVRPARRRRYVRLAAASLAVVLGSMMTAQAFGVDVFGLIARWTDETFRFDAPAHSQAMDIPPPAGPEAFASLQEALDVHKIKEKVLPKWMPEGFRLLEVKVTPTPRYVRFHAAYENGEKFLSISVWQYESIEDAGSVIFEKDDTEVIHYEYDGITHYLMSNLAQKQAVWINGNLMCNISGDLTVSELERMVKSIYEE
jgi:hypothetical protein